MYKKLALLMVVCATACSKPPEVTPEKLSGYWEISEVKLPDGETKEYRGSTTVDYFELHADSTGFRKKMQPRLDGTFVTSDDTENFTLLSNEGVPELHFTHRLATHQEEIMELEMNRLVLRNDEDLTYIYKRFEPIDLK
ncbi:lipocalin family protein [Robertkochia aurantiaca]|uniref:lipocalin family protein n=1 Tax=Robertkochia aurantiaca TaxID=2873700 RepID=UPI001CCE1E21|nr:lipocalin family protein [Robertkochia sp. 3YJGBD-33]